MFLTFLFRSAPEEGLYCKPKYPGKNLFFKKNKYISVILAFVVCSIKLVTSAVGISLPLIFYVWDNLLIQVYKWSGTTHRFVAVKLQILLQEIITHPSISARFYWLLYVTWCKFTGRLSRNNPRLHRHLPSYYFHWKETKPAEKKPAQEFHLFISIILHGRKTNWFCRYPVMFTAKSWSQMLFQKVQKCQQNMLSTVFEGAESYE